MIDLTPLEVRQKKGDFRRGFRGYDVELVNDFLDLVADRMEELVKQNMALGDQVEELEEELREYREKERALSEALMASQKLREDARAHAEKEGELIIREARASAESARRDASKSLAQEEETLRQVRARRAQLVQSFRRLLERELSELAVIEETLELDREPSAPRAEKHAERKAEPRAERQAARPAPEGGSRETAAPGGGPERGAAQGPTRESAAPEAGEAGETNEEEDVQEDWLKSLVEE